MSTASRDTAVEIAALSEADIPEALALNNAAEPHVPATPEERFRRLLVLARLAVTARRGDDLLGFLIAVDGDSDHDSVNYAWFRDRYGAGRDAFAYVDRIVVAPAARGLGVGRKLYAAVEGLEPRPPRIFCEVNEIPPNPVSLAFHKAIGFAELAKVDRSPEKRVVMLEKPLT